MKKRIALVAMVLAGLATGLGVAYAGGGGGNGNAPAAGVKTSPVQRQVAAAGQVFWAVVDGDGTLARGSQFNSAALSSEELDPGAYAVIFKKNIRNCAYQATRGLVGSNGGSAPGYATVVGRFNDTGGVFVQVFDSSGNEEDAAFHLTVNC